MQKQTQAEKNVQLTKSHIWSYGQKPEETPNIFFTAGIFIDKSNNVLFVEDLVQNGHKGLKIVGGVSIMDGDYSKSTPKKGLFSGSFVSELRKQLEECFIENKESKTPLYTRDEIDYIVSMEKKRKRTPEERNLIFEFIEEVGLYPAEFEFVWYQKQVIREWHQYFFYVTKLMQPTGFGMQEIVDFKVIKNFKTKDTEISDIVSLPYRKAVNEIFTPHQTALRAAGWKRAQLDKGFEYMFSDQIMNPSYFTPLELSEKEQMDQV